MLFQSTPSVWRETPEIHRDVPVCRNFNPLPPYGGRLFLSIASSNCAYISIHSLRMEGDLMSSCSPAAFSNFNPLPPYGGRPARSRRMCGMPYFNPLPPYGGRLFASVNVGKTFVISIHSLRMEGDSKTAQESVFHFAYPCTILQKRMQKTTFCTRKNDFFRKKGEKFGAKPPASFCAPMIRTDIFPQTSLTESAALPCLWFPLHRYVPPSTDNDFPGNKTAGCPFLYQSPVPADA